jgi:predicted MPP superfamily phosphohydrolase
MTESESSAAAPHFPVRRAVRFGLIAATLLLVTNAFVCATWSVLMGTPGWLVWQVIPGSLSIAFVATTILAFRHANPLIRIIYGISAAWLGALNFAFFAAVACWIVAGLAWLTGQFLPGYYVATSLFGVALVVTLYGLVTAALTRVTRIDVSLPHLPEIWNGRTVALVTDLHLGHIAGPAFLRRVLARLRSLQPDAVLISGDMFDGPPVELNRLAAEWRNFSTPKGIFFVAGNHDEFAARELYLDAVERVGIRVLNNELISVDGLQIVGVHDSEAGNAAELRSILRRIHLDPNRASILLAHRPENLAIAEEAGISLQLSGHTHGGQIWPWNMLASRIYGRFVHGLNRFGKLQVYTSYGVATWGPPLRVGTHSEIVLIRFVR